MTTSFITTVIPYVNARPHLGFAYAYNLVDKNHDGHPDCVDLDGDCDGARRGDRVRGLVARGPGDRDRAGGRAVGRALAAGLPDEPTALRPSLSAPPAGIPGQHVPVAALAEDTSALFGARAALGASAMLGRGGRPRRDSPCPAYATTSQDYRDPRKCPIPPELPGDRELLASPTRCGKLGP